MENTSGKFIVIDGTDGSGKTTQLNLLKEKLEAEGYAVAVADFPQYNTKSAGMVEEYLSGKYGQADEVGPFKASIFYAVDRFDASYKIKTWLKEGKVVLSNRYTSASLGHQGGKIDNPLERKIFFNWLYDLEYKIFEIPKPDLTIILQVEPEISFMLAKERGREDWRGKTKDIHEDNFSHLKKAEQTYLEIAANLPGFKLIKCTHNGQILSREAIHILVWLATSQIIIHQNKLKQNFQSIGHLLSNNEQILKNRELILNGYKNNGYDNSTNNLNNFNKNSDTQKTLNKQNAIMADTEINNFDTLNFNEEIPKNLPFVQEAKKIQFNFNNNEEQTEKQTTNNTKKTFIVEKLSPDAKLPQKAHQEDAGYDLYANDYYSIPAYGQALVKTGLKLAIPNGYVGLIWDKSGLANEGITTMGGVIDANYRGEIKIIIKNLSEDFFNIVPGQKIAQLILQPIAEIDLKEDKISDNTERQNRGFGSSGKF